LGFNGHKAPLSLRKRQKTQKKEQKQEKLKKRKQKTLVNIQTFLAES